MSRLLLYRPKRSRTLNVDLKAWLTYYTNRTAISASDYVCGTCQDDRMQVEDPVVEQDMPNENHDVEMNTTNENYDTDTEQEDDQQRYIPNAAVIEMSYFPMEHWFELLNRVSHVQYMLFDVIHMGYLDLLYNLHEGINVSHFLHAKCSLQKDTVMRIVLKQLIKNCSKNSAGHDSETGLDDILPAVLMVVPDYGEAKYISSWIRDRSEY